MPKTNWESFAFENQYKTEVLQALEKLHVSQEIGIPTFNQATLDVLLCNDDFVVRANNDSILNAKYSIDERAASDHQAIVVKTLRTPRGALALKNAVQQMQSRLRRTRHNHCNRPL